MKILSNKKYDELEQRYVEMQLDLNEATEDNRTYLKQVATLNTKNQDLEKCVESLEDKVIELEISLKKAQENETSKAKEVKKLKSLLTKNKIDYSHLYAKVKKNARKQ